MALHQNQPILTAGTPLTQARAAMILLHGRGGSAVDILTLADEFQRDELAYLAPQAAQSTWYPYRFIEPAERNEPYLSSALQRVGEVLAQVQASGIPAERTFLLGFSQGACLTLEYAARHPARYGGVIVYSGGLIGDSVQPENYPGSFEGTPVFLGCSDVDFHIPLERVQASSVILRGMGADVTERIYPNMGHTINEDELAFAQRLVEQVIKA
jgi:predicted esterase